MRSGRGLFAASAFLLVVPLALVGSTLFNLDAEITVHFVAAMAFAVLALSVFDFRTPRWLTWAACVAAGISAATYLLQGLSNLVPTSEALHYVAFQLLGQQLERVLPDVLILWFMGLVLTDSRGKTRLLGFAILTPVVAIQLLGYGFSLFGGSLYDAAPIAKAAVLLPFVWLPFESTKKDSPHAGQSTLLAPSTTPA